MQVAKTLQPDAQPAHTFRKIERLEALLDAHRKVRECKANVQNYETMSNRRLAALEKELAQAEAEFERIAAEQEARI